MSPEPVRYPASTFDIVNVYFERIYDPTMHVVLAFDGTIDAGVMREATMRLIAANPYLRSRFADEGEDLPVWEEIPEEAWQGAFVLVTAEEGRRLPPPPLDVRSGPQVRVTIYRRDAGEGDLLAVTCHHGFCDAAGVMTLARQVVATYRRIREDPGFRPAPTGAYDRSTDWILARTTEEERRRELALEEPFIDRWRFPAERPGRGTPRVVCRTLHPERLGRIKAFGRRYGATVNDILIGAFFLALLRIRNDPSDRGAPRSILTSVDLRRRHLSDPRACPPMNLSVAYVITLAVEEAEAELEDIIGQVVAITSRRKAGNLGLASILFYEEIMAGGMPAVRAFFDEMVERYLTAGQKNPVFSNLGIVDPDDYLPVPGQDGTILALQDIQYLPCVCWPYGFLMTASTFRNCLTITTAYEEGPYATATMERFLKYVDDALP